MLLAPIADLHWAYQLHYYVCFRTRSRRKEFHSSRQLSLARALEDVCSNHDYHLLQHKIYPDHLRCLLSLRPDHALSAVLNKIKSNASRQFCSEFQLACLGGSFKRALDLQDRLMPLHDALFVESNPGPVKYAAEKLGLCSSETRLPLAPLTDASKAKVEAALRQVGLFLV